jgi:hypothetical protein
MAVDVVPYNDEKLSGRKALDDSWGYLSCSLVSLPSLKCGSVRNGRSVSSRARDTMPTVRSVLHVNYMGAWVRKRYVGW